MSDTVTAYDRDYARTPEERLMRAVLAQAFRDASGQGINESPRYRDLAISNARNWLTGNSADFRAICALADVDPDTTISKAHDFIADPAPAMAAFRDAAPTNSHDARERRNEALRLARRNETPAQRRARLDKVNEYARRKRLKEAQ